MSDLTALLNKGKKQVPVTAMVNPFDVQIGPIPKTVPVLRDNRRAFAGGRIVLAERLDALRSEDNEKIQAWGNNYYDLADACITFEDMLKPQPDSPLLKGIRGIVEISDGFYVAVDAKAVSKSVKGDMKYFPVRESEQVNYGIGDNKVKKQVNDIVLFRYNSPYCMQLDRNQFNAVDAPSLKRSEFINERPMEKAEIVKNRKIVHPVYKILYPAKLVSPLTTEIFKFNDRTYGYDTNMGVYLPGEPKDNAEVRAFCVNRFFSRSDLYGYNNLGYSIARLVGVVEKSAAGAKK